MEQKQWIAIILTIIVDVILAAIILLALGPQWLPPNLDLLVPQLNLILSPLIVLSIVLVPTIFFLHWGWPEKFQILAFLLPLRLALAYEFLHGGLEKLLDVGYLADPGLIAYAASAAPSPWIQGFMTALLPNYALFLALIALGELLIGLSMLLGGFTRLGALGGILIQWTFLFLLGWLSVSTFGVNFLGAFAFLAIGIYRAGRYLGIDRYLGSKLEKSNNSVLRFLGLWT